MTKTRIVLLMFLASLSGSILGSTNGAQHFEVLETLKSTELGPRDFLNKRFKLKRNSAGELLSVKMKLVSSFSLAPYLKQIKDDIISEVKRMQTKGGYELELDTLLEEITDDNNKESVENTQVLRESILNLKTLDVKSVFKSLGERNVLKRFEFELSDALKMVDLAIIANPNDARYFYRKNVTYEVVKRALDFAKKRFDNIPLLNIASFVIVRVHELVLEQRKFHQNVLLHYLENFKASELGLSKEEADKVMSSIYESQISLIGYNESNYAARNWNSYGFNKFYALVRLANNKLRSSSFDKVNKRYNYAFVEVIENDKRVVKNLVNSKHSFSSAASTAYYFDSPGKVRRIRSLLNLGEVGLGFLPIPSWIKGQVHSFVRSFYVAQKLTEGSLVAYFELNGNKRMSSQIKRQMINPFIK